LVDCWSVDSILWSDTRGPLVLAQPGFKRSLDLSRIREEFGATPALRGSLERDDDLIRVNVQLVDSVTVLFFKATEPDPELEKGINFALKAIDIDPEFGMGYES